jgi:hypothetical protein
MLAEMTDLLGKRKIFWELQDVAKKNPRILNPGVFFHWLSTNSRLERAMHADVSRHVASKRNPLLLCFSDDGVEDRTGEARVNLQQVVAGGLSSATIFVACSVLVALSPLTDGPDV